MTNELKDRVVCLDEMCVGIIGPSNLCGMCGKPGPRAGVRASQAPEPAEEATSDLEPEPEAEPAPEPGPEEQPALDDEELDPSKRVLCPDDMCTGIIGASGRCGTCGREVTVVT